MILSISNYLNKNVNNIIDMKNKYWDIVFILLLSIVLLILTETNNINMLFKLPFITIYVSYGVGRFVGYLSNKKD